MHGTRGTAERRVTRNPTATHRLTARWWASQGVLGAALGAAALFATVSARSRIRSGAARTEDEAMT